MKRLMVEHSDVTATYGIDTGEEKRVQSQFPGGWGKVRPVNDFWWENWLNHHDPDAIEEFPEGCELE